MNTTISGLLDARKLIGNEVIPMDQDGVTVKNPISQLLFSSGT